MCVVHMCGKLRVCVLYACAICYEWCVWCVWCVCMYVCTYVAYKLYIL